MELLLLLSHVETVAGSGRVSACPGSVSHILRIILTRGSNIWYNRESGDLVASLIKQRGIQKIKLHFQPHDSCCGKCTQCYLKNLVLLMREDMTLTSLIKQLPKAELHLHIEGSLEPALLWQLAQKNGISLAYKSPEEIEAAYRFSNLQNFLDIYYQGAAVLQQEDDFFALMWAYLQRCKEQNIVHAEIMFDPQTHTQRGVGFEVFMPGFLRAIDKAREEWGMSVLLIMCFLRHLSEEKAIDTLVQARPFASAITAVGLDSSELGHPPVKFKRVFAQAREEGFKCVAHAGEEGPADYIWQAINDLKVDRIDHGIRCEEDPALMRLIKQRRIPLTVCPLSNLRLCVIKHIEEHNIFRLLDAGLNVTVNSDDPTYFGGYLDDNFMALEKIGLTEARLRHLLCNSFDASFLPEAKKQYWKNQLQQ